MDIRIKIENKVVEIGLWEGEKFLDKVAIAEEYRLSEDLLPAIDNLLKKNKLEARNIGKMVLESDLGDNFTTHRIAAAVANAFNWAIKLDKS
ncbi:MAG: hypothetical protein Q8L10_01795 [Candidatus Moranbacteria bacterium]|nr:hypothetical protein [Candidatus Moranbacteria bacterium]